MEDPKKTETPETPAPKWEHRKSFRINDRMKEIIGLTIKTSEAEIATLRRKLQKMTYGS